MCGCGSAIRGPRRAVEIGDNDTIVSFIPLHLIGCDRLCKEMVRLVKEVKKAAKPDLDLDGLLGRVVKAVCYRCLDNPMNDHLNKKLINLFTTDDQ